MPKRKQQPTSMEAYRQAEDIITPQMMKIIAALKILKKAIAEEIANATALDKNQVSRRVSEMEEMQLLHRPGTTRPTSSNRPALECLLTEKGLQVATGVVEMPTPPVVERIRQHKKREIKPLEQLAMPFDKQTNYP